MRRADDTSEATTAQRIRTGLKPACEFVRCCGSQSRAPDLLRRTHNETCRRQTSEATTAQCIRTGLNPPANSRVAAAQAPRSDR
jgi:hypothetical protein